MNVIAIPVFSVLLASCLTYPLAKDEGVWCHVVNGSPNLGAILLAPQPPTKEVPGTVKVVDILQLHIGKWLLIKRQMYHSTPKGAGFGGQLKAVIEKGLGYAEDKGIGYASLLSLSAA